MRPGLAPSALSRWMPVAARGRFIPWTSHMNVWNNRRRESSAANPKGSWLGAVARSLMNWWDKFLWLETRPERSQSPEEAFPPVSVQEDTATAANLREP